MLLANLVLLARVTAGVQVAPAEEVWAALLPTLEARGHLHMLLVVRRHLADLLIQRVERESPALTVPDFLVVVVVLPEARL